MVLDLEKAVGIVVAATVVHVALAIAGLFQRTAKREGMDEAFKAQLAAWHAENSARHARVEMALGLHNPNETAFPRRQEFEDERTRVWEQFDEHDQRIRVVERRNP